MSMPYLRDNGVRLESYQADSHLAELERFELTEDQRQFTGMPVEMLALAAADPHRHPVVIVAESVPVGFFILYDGEEIRTDYTSEPHSLLVRAFSINFAHQGKGYAKQGLNQLGEYVNEHFPGTAQLVLAVNAHNQPARSLYLKCGFRDQGQMRMGPKGPQHILYKPIHTAHLLEERRTRMGVGTQIRQVLPLDESLAALILKLDEYLLTKYPPEEISKVDFSDPTIQKGYFAVAYLDDTPVGCGGFLPFPEQGFAELRRFFVDPAYRNKGIARQVLTHLEEVAGTRGFRTIRLETGEPQVEAVNFYLKHGYNVIERYGEYADWESSLCMEKQIVN